MTNRWVCARCFTSAEESATVCPNCGLPRGMAPESAGQSGSWAEESSSETPDRATTPSPGPAAPSATPAPVGPVTPSAEQPPTPSAGAEERWVCRRCFNSNDGWRTTCTNCGQERNAASPDVAQGGSGWAPAQPASGGMQIPWRLVIYGVIALVVFGGSVLFAARRDDSGSITGAGNLSVFDLQVGDCFDAAFDPNAYTEISEVRAIPCDEPHVYEMYSVAEYPQGEAPSGQEENYTPWEQENCLGMFAAYVGIDYDSSVYYISALVPTDESWSQGDNSLMCFLHNDEETAVTGSARGSGR